MTAQKEISLACQLTVRDLYLFSLATIRRKFWWFLLLMCVLILFFVYNIATSQISWNAQAIAAFAFFFVFIPYAFFVAPYFAARKRARTDPRLQKPINYNFSETAIEIHSSTGDSNLNWTAFTHALETRSLFLLYPQQMVAHVLPKRCFANETDIRSFRELLRSKLSKVSLLKN